MVVPDKKEKGFGDKVAMYESITGQSALQPLRDLIDGPQAPDMTVPDLGLVVGLPGKVIKTLPNDTYEKNVKWAKKYVQLAAIHKSQND